MDTLSLASLALELLASIHTLSAYPLTKDLPEIHQVPQIEIQRQFCHGPCEIRAAYEPALGVYIDEKLDLANSDFARSILLHELVHHLQAVSGRFDRAFSECVRKNSAEQEAYEIQNRYLLEMNDGRRISMTGWASRCREAEVPTPKSR